jgi:hypothetical protein
VSVRPCVERALDGLSDAASGAGAALTPSLSRRNLGDNAACGLQVRRTGSSTAAGKRRKAERSGETFRWSAQGSRDARRTIVSTARATGLTSLWRGCTSVWAVGRSLSVLRKRCSSVILTAPIMRFANRKRSPATYLAAREFPSSTPAISSPNFLAGKSFASLNLQSRGPDRIRKSRYA